MIKSTMRYYARICRMISLYSPPLFDYGNLFPMQRCGIVNGVVEAEKGINDSEAVNQELVPQGTLSSLYLYL